MHEIIDFVSIKTNQLHFIFESMLINMYVNIINDIFTPYTQKQTHIDLNYYHRK